MVRDHEAVNKQALALVKKLKVTPEDNDTSKTLSKNAADKLAELGKLKGAAFDKAYVANEVAYHKAVDDALETTLIPNASDAELKSLLQNRPEDFSGPRAIPPKRTVPLVLKKAGTVDYYCRFHPNMKATLTVAP